MQSTSIFRRPRNACIQGHVGPNSLTVRRVKFAVQKTMNSLENSLENSPENSL